MTVIGADRLMGKLKSLPMFAEAKVMAALNDAAQSLKDDAARKIDGGKRSGRVYQTPFGKHQASAPGEYPKTLSGQLVASLFKRTSSSTALTAEVGTGLDYGKFLEFGTSRMLPRPWLRPSFLEVLPSARNAIYSAMASAIKQAH
ncbi:HK97 gp10 family phage protein [Bradyrhizobium diazoefficiens]